MRAPLPQLEISLSCSTSKRSVFDRSLDEPCLLHSDACDRNARAARDPPAVADDSLSPRSRNDRPGCKPSPKQQLHHVSRLCEDGDESQTSARIRCCAALGRPSEKLVFVVAPLLGEGLAGGHDSGPRRGGRHAALKMRAWASRSTCFAGLDRTSGPCYCTYTNLHELRRGLPVASQALRVSRPLGTRSDFCSAASSPERCYSKAPSPPCTLMRSEIHA